MDDSLAVVFSSLKNQRERKLSRSSIGSADDFLNKFPPLLTTIISEESAHPPSNGTKVSLVFKNGSHYEGDIEKGLLHGHGKYTWTDGTIYEGEFKTNCITGSGIYKWTDGSSYKGEVINGLRHGYGTYSCANHQISYSGKWLNGQRHGKGKLMYDCEGHSFYDGEWKHDKQCGHGMRQYSSGNVYKGEWQDSHRHGHGTMYWKDRGEQYTGDWVNGIQHGIGEHIWLMNHTDHSQYPLRNYYIGEWINGIRQGKGTFYYASGGQYEGMWLSNKKHGPGKFTLQNGQTIEGIFHEDKLMSQVGGSRSLEERPQTPLGYLIGDIDGMERRGSSTQQFNLHISTLLPLSIRDQSHEYELKQVHCVILRYLTQLRKIYHTYSSLGINEGTINSRDKMLKKIQLWQLLRDCEITQRGLTLAQADNVIQKAHSAKGTSSHDPTDQFLMREFLQCLVFLSNHIYSTNANYISGELAECLDKFMKDDCLPRACQIKGHIYQSKEVTRAVQPYLEATLSLYKSLPITREDCPILREFLFMIKKHGVVDLYLTPTDIVSILVSIQPLAVSSEEKEYNMEIPMVFLEFVESLLHCALHWYQQSIENDKSQSIIEKETEASHKPAVTVLITSDSKTITLDDYYDNKETVIENDKKEEQKEIKTKEIVQEKDHKIKETALIDWESVVSSFFKRLL